VQIKGVDFIWCMASDPERSGWFYRDLLGLPEADDFDPVWPEFQVGDATLAVTPLHVGRTTPDILVAFAVDDVYGAVAEARRKGVPVLHDVRDTPWCWNAMIADPDGNPIWLHKRKDGTVG
ncbi:MAG: VOC family protein, partial [Actinobacteria bacterium]|nr:VOC family protein [Actinomycetota bacterium]